MNLQEYILNEIHELSLTSSLKTAQELFDGFPITHIPIVENGHLLGCLSERDAHMIEDNSASISEYAHLIDYFFADEKSTILELITLFADHDCNMMPALSKDRKYKGYFELSDILDVFSNSPFLHGDGVEIVVEKLQKDFAVSQVTQIVESNNGKILGLYISNQTSDVTQATIKVSSEDINEIIQTFRRYNYNIISQYEDDFYLQDLKDRSDYLQKYLDM
jgi:predicted transcriptional regulator